MSQETVTQCLDCLESTRRLCCQLQKSSENGKLKKRQLFALLVKLREANRNAYLQLHQTSLNVAEAREKLNAASYKLEKLRYIKLHLQASINEFNGREHYYTKIPLSSKEAFLEKHPEKKELSEHECMIEMLNGELSERQKLSQARQDLLKKKASLISENKRLKNSLQRLDGKLDAFFRAAQPVKDEFSSTLIR
ncbi:hypothetical protein SJAG_04536 [Schizosaccharomyces japonicus yFS275]|uniref:THOC5 protein n=1 Tax=Schizosaccharomyces japonicus (strain yFS275 / FY16936) TaxID=402676 RepID=B6K732_SCHJY|nr:hypothetical protein SJAG_04536 [Schizosaccharomyces japonicus yFS275]EEB09336.1 hypothetical protein SJAG_04536 [Schizosaccharomyces japonicus yFS275]